ncbi:UbiA-like polyprenyltransferase [Desulfobacterales bacterium HSG16]|nr:UbiA-like polyprenyltransferase [Desulfobacterales bacterium HSG16]
MLKHFIERITVYGRMIKFSHTLFALPFALSAAVLANRVSPVTLKSIFWILLAMAGARSAAMGFNRIVDLRFDSKNPRTAQREIPAGKLSVSAAAGFVILFSILFIFAAAMLSKLCFYLSFPVLAILLSYSYTKRFTWFAHIYLGFAISLAPLGTWIALAGNFHWPILYFSLALMTYIAGFDILFSCQDMQFDKEEGLFSMPVRFGIRRSLLISSVLHIFSIFFLIMISQSFKMNYAYNLAVIIIAGLYYAEHKMVKPDDLSRVPVAFFHMNSAISIILFGGVAADEILRRLPLISC